ncbi:MAG: sodium:proton antiporter [Alistipes sp.]|nr:sodium:proton antiporter [Candidatus Alistipes equi]
MNLQLMSIPFLLLLVLIAVAPMVMEKLWDRNGIKALFVAALSLITIIAMVHFGMGEKIVHQVFSDYVPFIILLLALFVVTGGIHIEGDLPATPLLNSLLLIGGFLIASIIGTTGAAMLLIRPLLEINQQRKYKTHTILFFIAMVANCGGVLSPLGDPPLFMLFLRGAPFEWFLELIPEWTTVGFILISIYYAVDKFYYQKEDKKDLELDNTQIRIPKMSGEINIGLIFLIMGSIVLISPAHIPSIADPDANILIKYLREIVLLVICAASWILTPKQIRKENHFSWAPITEVAILFLGIFITMTPAMMLLSHLAPQMGLSQPWQFYYSTGLLSSFLDNTPTAVAFHTVAQGLVDEGFAMEAGMVAGIPEMTLRAIALAAVFFGSLTYIGNGPNFMVKAIAEQSGIKMPSFTKYITHFALVVLLPVYVIVQLIFL